MSDSLFDAVDALLAAAEPLPEPAERRRLREAGRLSLDQIGRALGVTGRTVGTWENGRTDPTGDKRAAYARLLDGLATRYPATPPAPVSGPPADPPAPSETPAAAAPAAQDAPAPPETPSLPGAGTPTAKPPTARKPPARKAAAPAVARPDSPFAAGPLVVLDGAGTAYGVGGLVLDCPAAGVPDLVAWALEASLGAPRLHAHGKDSDPLVVVTAAAAQRLGLPMELTDRRGLRLPEGHPVLRQLAEEKWELTRRGFGPWPRIFRRPEPGGPRRCVQLAVLPWGALDDRAWPGAAGLPPAELAAVLGDYATRVLTPRGSTATCGLELMSALRPPTRPVPDPATGRYLSGPVPGSFTRPIDPAPPEAPADHPLAQDRAPGEEVVEEAFDWFRPLERLTDAECAQPYVIGLDLNMAFAAAANRLPIGTGEPVHRRRPDFDPKTPGSWYVDLSGVETHPLLPSPFTPTGERPTGPGWYATPSVAYAHELGYAVQPIEAYLRPEHGPYLDPWYARLRDAYLATMAEVGVTAGMAEEEFLAAMARHKDVDPGRTALLSAIKATVKGGIGKLAERPQGARFRPGERWPALDRPTWSPHARQQVISNNRIGQHRKATAWARHGVPGIAVLADCWLVAAPAPALPAAVPRTPDGKPVPGGFRIGVSPGMVKLEGVQPFVWAAELIEAGQNPARHVKGGDA